MLTILYALTEFARNLDTFILRHLLIITISRYMSNNKESCGVILINIIAESNHTQINRFLYNNTNPHMFVLEDKTK
jgi:hypothetical protein